MSDNVAVRDNERSQWRGGPPAVSCAKKTSGLQARIGYNRHASIANDVRATDGQWELRKSFYRKLRLSPGWVKDQLVQAGFSEVTVDIEDGLVTAIAR